ncbi:MAG: M15 family metallopeptidase [Clostridia bacterium]|nr:M15 family metallopeptidase [Clostridia bacterium]MBR6753779.1 M15 family metallopeptidase [Clostridia bacterium]
MHKRWCMILAGMLCCISLFGHAASFDDDGLLRLVNRQEKITKNYKPDDLVKPNVPVNKKNQEDQVYMRREAAEALEKMFAAAKEEKGYVLLAVSGYRSYGEQQLIFNNKVQSVGSKEAAQKKVAPAGASEHQLGLAQDVLCDNFRLLNSGFLDTAEGKWLYENCHRFGFIVRYKKEWSSITGYSAEPWHFRYVGVSHATAISALDVPYETYAEKAKMLPEYILTHGNACLLYHVIDNALHGDGSLYFEVCAMHTDDVQQQARNIVDLTDRVRPEHVTLQDAIRNQGVK